MKKLTSLTIVLCMTMCSTVLTFAQQTVPQGKTVVIPDGTEISAVTTDLITSKTATEGDALMFKVDEDLIIDGVVVIAKGALVKAEVADAKQSGHFGRGGKLNVRVNSTETIDKQKIKLRAYFRHLPQPRSPAARQTPESPVR